MKKITSIITIFFLLWGILIFVDYLRAYQGDKNLLITLDSEETKDYQWEMGLGYSVKRYKYDKNNVKNDQVLKEFKIFDFVVNKEVAKVNH